MRRESESRRSEGRARTEPIRSSPRRSAAPPKVGISLGDPTGIGPEVTAKALRSRALRGALVPILYGDESHATLFRGYERRAPTDEGPFEGPTLVVVSQLAAKDLRPGKPNPRAGRAQYDYVIAAIDAAKAGRVSALCTAPVSKEQISRAGVPFMGHTEVLAERFDREVLMLMAGPRVRVALATNHLPLAKVPGALKADRLAAQLELLSNGLRPLVGRKPRLAVCGLNPHAGEGGLLGREEVEILRPAIEQARRRGVRCEGPLPADGLFAKADRMPYDGVLAMFHDQGLVAAKALDFERTVNVTLGLPVPRTSPDHGTAYDLAGRGLASEIPMREALSLAARLSSRR